MSNVVEVKQLTKTYGNVTAIDEISFSIQPNRIYGLLGRNGAGKTTIMQILSAQSFKTSGEVRVFGESPYENNRVLSQICFIKESQKYPDAFRIIDILDLSASFFSNWDREYAMSLLEDFRLPPKRKMKALSRGMLSSVGIVVGLASHAPLTLFDEPYLGLDAVARSQFYNHLLEDYSQHPRTVLLSTHLIDEVSHLLEHVLVVENGRLIIDEETEALRGRVFTVVGLASKVEIFAEEKEIISREVMGNLVSANILGNLNTSERQRAETLGLDIVPVSLQQLIIDMTSGKAERKAVKAL
jgi:ABC-2 type transport system ATP-binding protein